MQKKIYLLSAFLLCSVFSLLAQVSINLPSQNVSCGETLSLPITVNDFTNLQGLSFTLQWDPTQMEYKGQTTVNDLDATAVFGENNIAGGVLTFSWFDVGGVTLTDGTTIIDLSMEVIGNNFSNANLSFTTSPTDIIATVNLADVIPSTTSGVFTLVDTEDPTVTCNGNQSVIAASGATSATVSGIEATSSDNCGIATTAFTLSGATTGSGSGDASGQAFNIGITTVTYTVTDFRNNSATCTFDVEVSESTNNNNLVLTAGSINAACDVDVLLPVSVTGFQDITDLGATISWDPSQFTYLGISDFAAIGLDISNFDITQAPNGTISLTWNNATAQTLANGLALFNLALSGSSNAATGTIIVSGLTAQQNGAVFPASGANGTVVLVDNIPPTITACPPSQTVAAVGQLSAVVNDLTPTATDNCGSVAFAYSLSGATTGGGVNDASGASFNVGVTTVTYTATDASGLTATCSFDITVTGVSFTDFTLIAQSASASCEADDITININVGAFDDIIGTQFSVNWDPAVLAYVSRDIGVFTNNVLFAEDNLANGEIGYTWFESTGQTLADGSTLFTLHFTPVGGGGTSPVSFSNSPVPIEVTNSDFTPKPMGEVNLIAGSVAITDTEAPTVIGPANIEITLPMGATSIAVDNLEPIILDNCGGLPTLTYTLSGATTGSGIDDPSGLNFNPGVTTITYTVTDGGGNTSTATTTVTVTIPGAMEVNVLTPTAACGDTPFKVDITADNFVDGVGLQFSVDWDETVLQFDSIGSNFGLPIVLSRDFRLDQTTAGRIGFAWFDNTFSGLDLADGTILYSIYYTILGSPGSASDISITDLPVQKEGTVIAGGVPMIVPLVGNNGEATIIDNSDPVITNPFPATLEFFVPADACSVLVDFTAPTFSDACTSNLNVTSSHQPGMSFGVSETTIIYSATDAAGNSVSTSTILTVRDTTGPVIAGCPDNITIVSDTSCQAVVSWTVPTATDNCQLGVISGTQLPGSTFGLGTTTVTYTAEDVYGNRSTCSFDVTVVPGNPLAFENFPGDITVNAVQGECGATIGWLPPTVTGGCGDGSTVTLTCTAEPNTFFPVGSQAVQYTATDGNGQTITQTFIVTVIDNQEIVVICPTDITIGADGSVLMDDGNFINSVTTDTCGQYVITYNDITAFDNCSPINQTQIAGLANGSTFTFGTTAMAFELSDTLGNSLTCTFQITITETADLQAVTLDDPNCAGSDLRLSVNTVDGGSYQWNGPGGFSEDLQNPVIPNAMTQNSGDYIVKVVTENGCLVKDSVSVGILSAPEVEATTSGLDCASMGDTIRLFATITNGIPAEFSWTGPGNFATTVQNPLITDASISNVGIYTVTATSGNGCSTSATVVVGLSGMVMPILTSDAGSDTICANTPFTLTGTAYDGLVNYEWFAPAGAGLPAVTDTNVILVTPTEAGTYTYEYTVNLDGNCTSDTAQIDVVVLGGAGAITISSNGPFDCAALNGNIELSAIGGEDIIAYAWTGPNDFTETVQNPVIPVSNEAGGTYELVATSSNGCTASNSMDIVVTAQGAAPEVTLSSPSNNVCEGDGLTMTAADVPGATYSWVGPNDFTSSQQVINFTNITADAAGAYQVKTTIDVCESVARTVGPIIVLSDPAVMDDAVEAIRNQSLSFSVIDNDGLLAGAPYTITVISDAANGTLTNNGDGTFLYDPNTDFTGMDQMLYELCYDDCPDLCGMGTITVRTEFPPGVCVVPTLITPNGDDINDALIISCVADPPKIGSEIIIWNEWGSEVFRESPYQNNWQGTYNGKDLPDGTYYYVFKEDSDDNDPVKGYVTIFR